MKIQVERMATIKIKLDRVQTIEAAHFLKARQIAYNHQQERAAKPGQSPSERAEEDAIAQLSAMPDLERLAHLQRYQTSLDRQLSKVIGEIRVLKDMPTIVSRHTVDRGNTVQTMTQYSNGSTNTLSSIEDDPSHESDGSR